jgi:hypothetical protein
LFGLLLVFGLPVSAGEVFVRFKMAEPAEGNYHVVIGGYLHSEPWYLPKAVWPEGADRDAGKRVKAGEFTPWFNIRQYAGKGLHGRMSRAGGFAEFPNITTDFIAEPAAEKRRVVIEIATEANEAAVVKRLEESYTGSLTSFLVSPDPKTDAASLETAGMMSRRHLEWAKAASGGKRVSPQKLIVQTALWGSQRPELDRMECEAMWLMGFNVVGGLSAEMRKEFPFGTPNATHEVAFGPNASREDVDGKLQAFRKSDKTVYAPGMPFNFGDEVTCPVISTNAFGLASFRQWLTENGVQPKDLGVASLQEVVPIENPTDLRERQKANEKAANRVFYWTSRFRQAATTQTFKWNTESLHRHFGPEPMGSTLVADHPYFSGTGLGMGMGPSPCWGSTPLACDWFDMARRKALDAFGIEDWMGLQYMYGPNYTWEGFQLMGFQAAMIRSASRSEMPVITWITPSDERNLVLKSSSALCQGAKHFFYWSYGPTATCTENYWSDLQSAYAGVARMSRQLAGAEKVIAPGKVRPTRLALLYSISSDLWQPFGYVHMLERRMTYLSLIHDQFLVDFLTEEDVESGRLKDYDVLYVTDPCIREKSAAAIVQWVKDGGSLYGSCAAGSRNEFNEPVAGLSEAFGIAPEVKTSAQPGAYHIRGALNGISYLDTIQVAANGPGGAGTLGVIGMKAQLKPATRAEVVGSFKDGQPAIVQNVCGKGKALYVGACPAIAYGKEANFVPTMLAERWTEKPRAFINALAKPALRWVELSRPVVEAGLFDAATGSALILGNFTYEPIPRLNVRVLLPKPCAAVRSMEKGPLQFKKESPRPAEEKAGYPVAITFELPLDLNDIVLFE